MAQTLNPAQRTFLRLLGSETQVAQAWIVRRESKFELRHINDRNSLTATLHEVPVGTLRDWARRDARGEFRPLMAAPDLRSGWLCRVEDEWGLIEAVDHLYPGAIADLHAVLNQSAMGTSLDVVVSRQVGRYRAISMISDLALHQTIDACCADQCCLKRRLWSARSVPGERWGELPQIPCLEPCPLLLDSILRQDSAEQQPSPSPTAD